MIEILKTKKEKLKNNNDVDTKINTSIEKAEIELKKMKFNINNLIFCRLYKEFKKNSNILLKFNSNTPNEITMMRTLTQLNIVPISSIKKIEINSECKKNDDKKINKMNQFLYFLLSKNISKNISTELGPFEFWKTMLKFKKSEINYKK